MKKISKILLALTAAAFVLFSTGCSVDSDDSSSGDTYSGSAKVPDLPPSVGENILNGKTFMKGTADKYIFEKKTFEHWQYETMEDDSEDETSGTNAAKYEWVKYEECAYTYNAKTKLLSYRLEKVFDSETEDVTAYNYYSLLKKELSGDKDKLEFMDKVMAKRFSVLTQKTVSIEDTEGTLTNTFDVTKYFDFNNNYFNNDEFGIFYTNGETKDEESICFIPDFSAGTDDTEGSFSATCYLVKYDENDEEIITKLGTAAKGTYTVDTTNNSITLKFTEFPEHTFSNTNLQITTETEYKLIVSTEGTKYTVSTTETE